MQFFAFVTNKGIVQLSWIGMILWVTLEGHWHACNLYPYVVHSRLWV